MADLNDVNSSLSVKLVGNDSLGIETTPVNATTFGALLTNLRDANGNEITSTLNSSGRSLDSLTPDNTATTTLGALDAVTSIACTGLGSVGFQLSVGTLTGTIIAEGSIDGGTTWVTVPFYDITNTSILQSITLTSPNALRILSIIPLGGASHIRVRVSAYTSGSATGTVRASKIVGTTGQITTAAFSNVTNTFPAVPRNVATLILAANPNRKYAYISNNTGNVVNIQMGNSTGLSATTGLIIPSNEFYEFKGDNLYTGDIYAFTGANGVVLAVSEGTP